MSGLMSVTFTTIVEIFGGIIVTFVRITTNNRHA
jgi:hypothetical protein